MKSRLDIASFKILNMKRLFLLLSFSFIFALFFQGRFSRVTPAIVAGVIKAKDTAREEKPLIIKSIYNGSLKDQLLNGVTVRQIRGGQVFNSQTYLKNSLTFMVKDGDILEFTEETREKVSITINAQLKIKQIEIFMFVPKTRQAKESVEGTTRDKSGNFWTGLPVVIGTTAVTTNVEGVYKSAQDAAMSFTIQYGSPTALLGIITANTTPDGGRVVIDVAFDEDATKNDL